MRPVHAALACTLASAVSVNWGYLREHRAAMTLAPVSISMPIRSITILASSREWLVGFAAESVGWVLFVVALSLAPLALVQAVSAGGVGVLALLVCRFRPSRLDASERQGALTGVFGLALLAISLIGGVAEGTRPPVAAILLWTFVSVAVAAVVAGPATAGLGRGAALGIATGVLFACGDVAMKATATGMLIFAPVAVCAYIAGSILLQTGFQHAGALVTAGLATLVGNVIPILAGMALFREPLPDGPFAAARLLGFVAVTASASLLARPR